MYGATEGSSMALAFAAGKGHLEIVRWLLEHTDPDLGWQDFQGKTSVQSATQGGHSEVAELLRQYAYGKPG